MQRFQDVTSIEWWQNGVDFGEIRKLFASGEKRETDQNEQHCRRVYAQRSAAYQMGRASGPNVHDLAARDLLPSTDLLDSGYVDVDVLVTGQRRYQVDSVGPLWLL
jgi:hypothetical protein